jgi:hypothetical protein
VMPERGIRRAGVGAIRFLGPADNSSYRTKQRCPFRSSKRADFASTVTNTTIPTATRDLADMVARDAMTRTGERRYTRYYANILSRPVPWIAIDRNGQIIEEG